jgi:hypothetical protein
MEVHGSRGPTCDQDNHSSGTCTSPTIEPEGYSSIVAHLCFACALLSRRTCCTASPHHGIHTIPRHGPVRVQSKARSLLQGLPDHLLVRRRSRRGSSRWILRAGNEVALPHQEVTPTHGGRALQGRSTTTKLSSLRRRRQGGSSWVRAGCCRRNGTQGHGRGNEGFSMPTLDVSRPEALRTLLEGAGF